MKIAYLDPPYSLYFHRLATRLAERSGGQVLALLSSPAYRLYVGGDRTTVWAPGPCVQRHAVPPALARTAWARLDDEVFVESFSQAVEWLKQQFQRERIEVCLVYSDARPFSVAARLAADALGIRCVYFERGALRLRTSCLSTQGLNARFSLARAADGAPAIRGLADEVPRERRPHEPGLWRRFALFALASGVVSRLSRRRRLMRHTEYPALRYLRLAWQRWHGERRERRSPAAAQPAANGRPAVLLPLQLPADSQLRIGSPFGDNQALIEFVVRHVRQLSADTPVWVKRHPMDLTRYDLPAGALWIDDALTQRFDAAGAVVCVNSTAGFEAAVAGKPVLCFARSFYTDLAPVRLVGLADFEAVLREALDAGDDKAAGRALREAVARYYLAPGDVWAYTDADIDATVRIVMEHVAARV